MKAQWLLGDFFILFGVLFTVYLSVVMIRRIRAVVRKDTYREVFRYELIACAVFLVFALDLRFDWLAGRRLGTLVRGLFMAGCAVLVFFLGKVIAGGLLRTEAAAKIVLVLGLGLENGEPTYDLLSRLDTAERYLREHPEATLILTGGNPDAAGRTEAAVMRDLLAERGVARERLRLEDRAETTKDNFRNAAKMIDPDEPTVLITSNYHMDRAVQTARAAGFTHILRLPAPSSPFTFCANILWEAAMELNEWTLKRE